MWRSLILFCSAILCLSEGRFNTLSHHELSLLPPEPCQKQCLVHVASDDIHNCTRPLVHRYWCVLRHCIRVCRETDVKHIKVETFDANHLRKRRKRNASAFGRVRRKRGKTEAITTTTTLANNESTTQSMLEATTEPIKTVSETTTTTNTTETTTTSTQMTTKSMSSTKTSTDSVPIVYTTSAAVTTTRTNPVTPKKTTLSTTPYKSTIQTNNNLVTTTKNIAANTTQPDSHVAQNVSQVSSTIADSTNKTTTPMTDTTPKTINLTTIDKLQKDTTSIITETTVIAIPSAQTLLTIVVPSAVLPTTATKLTTKTSTVVASTISTTSLPSTPVLDLPTTVTPYLTHAVSPTLMTSPTTLARLRTPEVPKMQGTSKTTSESIPGAASSTTIMPTTSKLFRPVSMEPISVVSTKSVKGADQTDDVFIVAEGVAKHIQNTSILLAVLMLGILFFLAVLVLLIVQAYESYKKKDYTQVDYLINGMYADSEICIRAGCEETIHRASQ